MAADHREEPVVEVPAVEAWAAVPAVGRLSQTDLVPAQEEAYHPDSQAAEH